MKVIVGIGGAVIKTAMEELRAVIQAKKIDVLIHSGASIFHDFQRNTESLESHSHPLDELINDYSINRAASEKVWTWLHDGYCPFGSITCDCIHTQTEVLLSSMLGTDFWHLFCDDWELIARKCHQDFWRLCELIGEDRFIFVNMGSAVLMPELFTKALAVVGVDNLTDFRAYVVDFLPDQYRPKTRVAKYGKYFHMTHKDFLQKWLDGENWQTFKEG